VMTTTEEKNKLRVGIFSDSYHPYVSGVVRSIEILKDELENLGHDSYIFAPNYPLASKEKNVYRYLSIPAPTQRSYFLPIPFSPRLRYQVKELELDIIHVHSPFLLGSLGTLIAKRFNLPLIFTYHTLYHRYAHYLPIGKNLTSNIINKWNKNFCNQCDRVIAPSLFVKKLIEENGITTGVDVVPTGLTDAYYYVHNDENWLRKKFNIEDKEKILLYVGRLGKEKNLIFLIEAMKEILKTKPFTKLLIVGTGPEESNLKMLCQAQNLQDNILFSGQVKHQELLKCYSGADIFTFASQTETQGLVVGEAKASGLPVVSLYSPCMSEMIFNGKDGFLVHNLETFIEKVIYLLENEKITKSMGKRGKLNSIRFSSKILGKKMVDTYLDTIYQKSHLPLYKAK
jgi:1,2-diacylglycerol 3-alpha-glucosyltransferase